MLEGPYGYFGEKSLKDMGGRRGDEENASWSAREERTDNLIHIVKNPMC